VSCSHLKGGSSASPLPPPVLKADPLPAACYMDGQENRCVLLLEEDWATVTRWIGASCLQMGGDKGFCRIVAPGGP
jgi:hypothetical protein